MTTSRTSVITASSSVLCALALVIASPAFAETVSSQNARALLEEAKKSSYERKVAAKQTEIDRLSEDLTKGKQQGDDLKTSVEKVGSAISETTKELDQITFEKKRVSQELELVNLRIDAMKLKAEGLKLLEGANKKSLEALAKQNDEKELRTTICMMEMRDIARKAPVDKAALDIVASGPDPRGSRGGLSLTEMRKKLERAERATSTANMVAREAMATASVRLQQAESAAAKAEKKQGEIGTERNPGFPGGNDPLKP